MIDFEAELLAEHSDWRLVLQAYRDEVPPAPEPSVDGQETPDHAWVVRLAEVADVEPEALTKIHGKLIALGFLKFQLKNRSSGVSYRVTRQGKQVLNSLEADGADVDGPLAESA